MDILIKAYLGGLSAVIIIFVSLECAKARIFSGFPYIHPDKKEKSKTIKKAILRYLVGAAFEIAVSIYLVIQQLTTDKEFETWISGNQLKGLFLFIALALQCLICELYPISNVLDSYYVKVLARLESFHKIPLLPQGTSQYRTMLSSANLKSVQSETSSSKGVATVILSSGQASLEHFDINYLKPMSRNSGLGTIYFAYYKGHTVKVRQINAPSQVSSLMFSKLQTEIKQWREEVQNKCLEGYLACFQHETSTYLVTQAHSDHIPLKESLANKSWTLEDKYSLFRKLAKTLYYAANLKHPLHHGHLHPGNILVHKESGGMIVADLGLHFLKKYIGMLTNGYPEEYSNKQTYSSPQILLSKGKVVLKTSEKDDIYSFGLIFWEVLAGKECFGRLTLEQVTKLVCQEQKRPAMLDEWDDSVKLLILRCLDPVPEQRPTFLKILEVLNEVSGQ